MSTPRWPHLRIVCDIDGVLYDFEGASRFLLAEEFGVDVPRPSPYWSFAKDWLKDAGIPEAWNWLWKEGVERGLFRTGHMLKGALRGVRTLVEDGHLVVAVTSRPLTATADTLAWLGQMGFPFAEVHVIGPERAKTSVAPHADIYIDDALHIVDQVLGGTSAQALLWDAPYNQTSAIFDPPRLTRVKSWEEVHQIVAEEQERKRVRLSA